MRSSAAAGVASLPSKRPALAVGDFVAQLQAGLGELFPRPFWLEGEISGYKVIRNGHAFFALKDESAQVEAVLWSSSRARLRFTPEDGTQVFARVTKVDFYGPSGRLRVHVGEIEPRGAGAWARALEERRARLLAEGLFDEARKRRPPFLPRVIGIATAPGSAALRDMLEILRQRFADRRVLIRPCRVQGAGAAEDIAAALDDLNREASAEVILLGRGGGSMEDLWCFNEEVVVRAVARSKIPVIAGIGHEVDTTLADFAADLRVATPTAAAQQCVPARAEIEARLQEHARRLDAGLSRRMDLLRARLRRCKATLADPRQIVSERRARLETLAVRARQALQRLTPERRRRLERAAGRLRVRLPRTDLLGPRLRRLGGRLESAMLGTVERARAACAARAAQIEALSPLAVLGRGFAIARRQDGRIVRDAGTLSPGDELDLRFARGGARSRVLEVLSDRPPVAGTPDAGEAEES